MGRFISVTDIRLSRKDGIHEKNDRSSDRFCVLLFGDGVKSIGNHAFDLCGALEEIVFPVSVTTLGSMLFYGCTSMQTIRYQGTAEEWSAVKKASDWNYGSENVEVKFAL